MAQAPFSNDLFLWKEADWAALAQPFTTQAASSTSISSESSAQSFSASSSLSWPPPPLTSLNDRYTQPATSSSPPPLHLTAELTPEIEALLAFKSLGQPPPSSQLLLSEPPPESKTEEQPPQPLTRVAARKPRSYKNKRKRIPEVLATPVVSTPSLPKAKRQKSFSFRANPLPPLPRPRSESKGAQALLLSLEFREEYKEIATDSHLLHWFQEGLRNIEERALALIQALESNKEKYGIRKHSYLKNELQCFSSQEALQSHPNYTFNIINRRNYHGDIRIKRVDYREALLNLHKGLVLIERQF